MHDSHADRFTAGPHFDFDPRTRIVFGPGRLARLGTLAKELGGKRVLVCTDAGIRAAGHAEHGIESLRTAGLDVIVFDDIQPNPTTEDVDRGVVIAREARVDLLVGLGGGSSMDTAKGINFVLTNGGRLTDYHGFGKADKPMLPSIGVPTTAGTGSEAQSFAVIGDAVSHVKMACGDRKAAFRVAILDPELTVSMPFAVTAATGIDALSHSLETYVTRPRNDIAQLFGRRAWSLLAENLPTVLQEPGDVTARGAMLLGAHFAGIAIENSMLGATHALANPLTARYDTTHGLAVGVMLPHVIRFNASHVSELYGDLADDLDLCDRNDPEAAYRLADFVSSLVKKAGGPTTLAECGVEDHVISDLAELAAKQWTGNFNPRPVDRASLEELYRCAM
jgi:alcohol dehydrogenase